MNIAYEKVPFNVHQIEDHNIFYFIWHLLATLMSYAYQHPCSYSGVYLAPNGSLLFTLKDVVEVSSCYLA